MCVGIPDEAFEEALRLLVGRMKDSLCPHQIPINNPKMTPERLICLRSPIHRCGVVLPNFTVHSLDVKISLAADYEPFITIRDRKHGNPLKFET